MQGSSSNPGRSLSSFTKIQSPLVGYVYADILAHNRALHAWDLDFPQPGYQGNGIVFDLDIDLLCFPEI